MSYFLRVLVVGLGLASTQAFATTILTFDGLANGSAVPDGYGGIDWGGNWFVLAQPTGPYSAHSGSASIYTQPGFGEIDFFFVNPALFYGAYFAIAPSNTVQFKLYDDGQLVWTSAILKPCTDALPGALGCQGAAPGTNPPRFLPSGYNALPITEVGVISEQGFFTMSDLVYITSSAPPPPTVPEPATGVLTGSLLIAGAAGTFLRRRFLRDRPL